MIGIQFERCLQHIFSKYCTPAPSGIIEHLEGQSPVLLSPPPDAYLSHAGLDKWAKDTNGTPFSEEAKQELKEFLDVNDDGYLTQVLQLLLPTQ